MAVYLHNRYEIGPVIGSGGMGTVYRGWDRETKNPVAIKTIHHYLISEKPETVERFKREAEALHRMNHSNIVKMIDLFPENDQYYLIMEYVDGVSLATRLDEKKQLPIDEVLQIGIELSDALSHAHSKEILHRDIKPANILVGIDGSTRLTDFGLARLNDLSTITESDAFMGTCYYLCPEGWKTKKITRSADIWAFGITLYEIIAAQLPFYADSPYQLMAEICDKPYPPLGQLRSEIPPELEQLIDRMLEKNPDKRIASARQIGAELENIQQQYINEKPNLKSMRIKHSTDSGSVPLLDDDDTVSLLSAKSGSGDILTDTG